ncbi:thyroid adenoma-associated protein homolog [Acanthaster planci]|uniref:Thyroid adenoma-associated protein homolog n=1 Tax=Acanthaster planci TaxID=133434 RepID=A0A8B7YCL8_ACAPL|nr:thyroid adenoma-associated protein homolog [Acanthaster planci]
MFSSVSSKGVIGRMMASLRDRLSRLASSADQERTEVGADFLALSQCVTFLSLHASSGERLTNVQAVLETVEQLSECLTRIHTTHQHHISAKGVPVHLLPFPKEEGLILSLACQVMSQLYVDQANNSKVFQKSKKALEKLMSLQPETRSHVEERFRKLIAMPAREGGISGEDLNKVSCLLESSDLVRGFLESNFHQILSCIAQTLNFEIKTHSRPDTGCVQPSRAPAMDASYQAAKVFLQMCQHGQELLRPLLWEPGRNNRPPSNECHYDLHQIISGLITLLESQRFSKDCGLLAGSALAMMMNSAPQPRQAAEAVANLLTRYSSKQIPVGRGSSNEVQIGTFVKDAVPLVPLPSTTFARLAITRGVLACCSKAILLQDVWANQERQVLCTDVLFAVVCDLCEKADGELKYHASEALKLYLQAMKHLLPTLCKDSLRLFGPDAAHTQSVLRLVWLEWQSPVDGVTEMMRSALSTLLDLHHRENKKQGVTDSQLVDSIASSLLGTAWHIKGRYLLLSSLVPHSGATRLLAARPSLPRELLRCLATNHLAAAATELHSTLVRKLREEGVAGGHSHGDWEEERQAEAWGSVWKDVMLEGLCSKDSLIRYHTAKYWLPSALKSFPGCFSVLMDSLARGSPSQPQQAQVDDLGIRNLHTCVILLKYARISSLLSSDWLDKYKDIISAGLWHSEDNIQADAFALLCCSPKKSELPSEAETGLLRETLPHFLNSDSAAFRNQLRHNVNMFVTRLCDGSLALLKRLTKLVAETEESDLSQKMGEAHVSERKTKGSSSHVGNGLTETESAQLSLLKERLLQAVDCLDWLIEMCFGSLFPGACYQRKRAALDILAVVFESLLSADKQQNTKVLMTWALDHGKCNLLSERNASLLLECIQDSSNDLRSSSYHLLATFYPAPLPSSSAYPYTSSSQVLCTALQLVSSPKVQESEAGALLTKLIFYKHSVVKSLKKLDGDMSSPPGSPVKSNSPSTENGTVHFVESLLTSLAFQLKCCKRNLLQAASVTPMHGLIRAIRRCVTEQPTMLGPIFASDPANWSALMEKLLAIVQDITGFILLILSGRDRLSPSLEVQEEKEGQGKASTMMAPSFGQMGEAIERLIADLAAYRTGEEEAGEGGNEEMLGLSEEHQLILACCWLNLKECSLLLGGLAEALPMCSEGDPGILTFDQVTMMANILVAILTRCRHKGAIDGCNQGFARLCSRLLASPCPELQAIPKTLLDRVLALVTDEGAGSSFTKKSAGLPLLVESIVSAEPRGRERPLLAYVMTKLMALANEPLPSNPNDRLDLPQAHALNVMMALFRCSAVGTDMMKHCPGAVEMAISGFASPCWMIRNCSMRLFGALVARMFGQKKVQDEHSQINTMSAITFFTRYPALQHFLLKELRKFKLGEELKGSEDEDDTKAGGRLSGGDEMESSSVEWRQGQDAVVGSSGEAGQGMAGDGVGQRGGLVGAGGGRRDEGRLFLHPSLHPVLTLLSKLGPGVGNSDTQSLWEFVEPVKQLAGSAICAVRELAARSLVPLIRQHDVPQEIVGIIDQLPGIAESARDCNRLHGELLQVEKLFQAALQNESIQQEDLVGIQAKLGDRTWIAGHSNPCAPVRALFVNVALAVLAECHRVCPDSGAMTLAVEMRRILRAYFEGTPSPFQIGVATLNKAMSTAYLRLIKMTPDSLTPDLLTSVQALLTSQDPDVKLATLGYLQSSLTGVLRCCNTASIQSLQQRMVDLLTCPQQDSSCLERSIALWVELGQGAQGSQTQPSCDWECLWNALRGLVEGQRGSGLVAASLPAIGQMLQWNHIKDSWTHIDAWCSWMVKYSHPTQSETIRLAAGQSMKIAAPAVWSQIAEQLSEDRIDIALDLMVVLLRLLQDELQDVRLEAAEVVSLRLPRESVCPQHRHLHCNAAQGVLLGYLCQAFSWSPKFMTSVVCLLHGSVDVLETTEQLASGGSHLFGQESANIYAEGIMEAKLLYQAIMHTVEREQAAHPDGFQTWLCGWYEGVPQLLDAHEDLVNTQQILETYTALGGTFCGVSSHSKPYQAIYRQLLYVRLLCSVAKGLEVDEITSGAMSELQETVKHMAEMPSVHPCLKTELSSLHEFLTE